VRSAQPYQGNEREKAHNTRKVQRLRGNEGRKPKRQMGIHAQYHYNNAFFFFNRNVWLRDVRGEQQRQWWWTLHNSPVSMTSSQSPLEKSRAGRREREKAITWLSSNFTTFFFSFFFLFCAFCTGKFEKKKRERDVDDSGCCFRFYWLLFLLFYCHPVTSLKREQTSKKGRATGRKSEATNKNKHTHTRTLRKCHHQKTHTE
jgi:hypothetical protein